MAIIGREREQAKLQQVLETEDAQFLAVYGRRRVGKTFLIRQYFSKADVLFFHVTGLKEGNLQDQLNLFNKALKACFYPKIDITPPSHWMGALTALTAAIEDRASGKPVVLFFDELPWLATKRSRLVEALDHFWNTDWSLRRRLKLIVCGSAASWMINTFINAKGGLYNRITGKLRLNPFTLKETALYLKSRGVRLDQSHILSLYMALGGIPYYLQGVQKGLSAAENISELCFQKEGLLFNEYDKLFRSLFNNASAYEELIAIIADKRKGLSKKEILKQSKQSSSGGSFNERLRNLEESGFISCYRGGSKKTADNYYRVVDEYTFFYLSWIEPAKKQYILEENNHYWQLQSQTPAFKAWAGYAFEAVCLKHIGPIKKALNIEHVTLAAYPWRYVPKGEDHGAQIDLVFDRQDGIITLCEIKQHMTPFLIDKSYAQSLLSKCDVFKKESKTSKHVFFAMITTQGLKQNQYSDELITKEITLNDLYV